MPPKASKRLPTCCPKSERASWILLTDMYDERADIHARLAKRMRQVSGTY